MRISAALRWAAIRTALNTLVLGALVGVLDLARPASSHAFANPGNDADSMSLTIGVFDQFKPKAVTDLTGSSSAEGQAVLQWTAPIEDDLPIPKPGAVASYDVRYATFSVIYAPFLGDTTAWFNAAAALIGEPSALTPGAQQTLITSLSPGVTYFFAIKSVDAGGNIADADANTYGGVTQAAVGVKGIDGITDLTALTGANTGEVDLVWSEPSRIGQIEPSRYDVRLSTVAQINTQAEFLAAKTLADFTGTSPQALPSPGFAPGTKYLVTLTGLTPGSTFYFASRAIDTGLPVFAGRWQRNGLTLNTTNFAQVKFVPGVPNAVTNLAAQGGGLAGSVSVTWSAPAQPSGVPMSQYILRMSSVSVADLGGDTTAWFNLVSATQAVLPAQAPGVLVSTAFAGLSPVIQYFFALKSVDQLGQISLIDTQAATVVNQASAFPTNVGDIVNLTAAPDTGASGNVRLSWTEPDVAGLIAPLRYLIRISSGSAIDNNAQFSAAQPLSALSGTTPPVPQAGQNPATFVLTGLVPETTYYFAMKVQDSNVPAAEGNWIRLNPGPNQNAFAKPHYAANPAASITNLSAVTGAAAGQVALTWSKPANANFTRVNRYDIRFSTQAPFLAPFLSDAAAWFNAAQSRSLSVDKELKPGTAEAYTLTGLEHGLIYYAGIRGIDEVGGSGSLDSKTLSVVLQASAPARGIAAITTLSGVGGAAPGSVVLSWTAPLRAGGVEPSTYAVRVSSTGNIADDAAFALAQTVFGMTGALQLPPAAAAAGVQQSFTVTGLVPFINYCFALRAYDSAGSSGTWRQAGQQNCVQSTFVPGLPNQITDLTAAAGGTEGSVQLSWTAPKNENFVPMAGYEVRYATYAVLADLTTAWFNALPSSAVVVNSVLPPGSLETLTINSLFPSSTFYFAVKSRDIANEISAVDTRADTPGLQAFAKPLNLPPAAPAGPTLASGLLQIGLSWTDLSPAAKGLDFRHYRIDRSTMATFAPVTAVTTRTATNYVDRPLDAFTTFYFRLAAVDSEGLEALSPAAQAAPYTIRPMAPFGVRYAKVGTTVTITWADTTRFDDTTPFISTSAPRFDEFTGYEYFGSSDDCGGFVALGTAPLGMPFFSDPAGSSYYLIRSTNRFFSSADSVIVSPNGDRLFKLPDCVSRVQMTDEQAKSLLKEQTGLPADISIQRTELTAQNGGKTLTTVEFKPMLDGATLMENFAFTQPVKVVLKYKVDGGGNPVPATMGLAAQSAAAAAVGFSANELLSNLGLFWHNNMEFKKLYGTVDTAEQSVTAFTPNLGLFQIRTVARDPSGATFDLSNITSRVITPNGDGRNDVILFLFDNPNNKSIGGKIFDLRGMLVSEMSAGPQPNSLKWDGRMNGVPATSGVYIYQIEGDGKLFNGTVVVAR